MISIFTAVDCGTPPPLTNGKVDTPSGTTYPSMATYSCFTGYNLGGVSTINCQTTAQWSSLAATCTCMLYIIVVSGLHVIWCVLILV